MVVLASSWTIATTLEGHNMQIEQCGVVEKNIAMQDVQLILTLSY